MHHGSSFFMSHHPKSPAKNPTGDFGQFTNFMRRLVAVPHSEIKAKLDAEKRAKTPKRKGASRASSERIRMSFLPPCQSPLHRSGAFLQSERVPK